MKLTLFDLDNTLLRGDSDYEWGQFLISVGAVDRAHYEAANKAFYEDYKEGRLDIQAFLAFALKPLTEWPQDRLLAWREEFVDTRIRPLITNEALDLVEEEKARADRLAIVTATNSFVTTPIAGLFGISTLIATEPALNSQGEFTGQIAGTPCFREGKITKVGEWLAREGLRLDQLAHSRFYSDSQNDLPLMKAVSEAIAVNPDPVLRAYAQQSGWPVLTLKPHDRHPA
jgi:HAD superfamily hydrolase (TIGR01490 family)